ncbi:MAG: quinone oxidoreductase [Rhodospirillales bacterium]|nr:quinone oxidoreductase [Rhodospirillales bacterium]
MTKAIRIYKTGSSDEMKWEDVEVGAPGPGQVLIRHTAVGLNFLDVYQRSGMYSGGGFPVILGNEGAGVIEQVGEDVSEFAVGDRVAYGSGMGSYAESRVINVSHIVKTPANIEDQTAAAMMLKGMTAMYLLRRTHEVKAGDTILVWAAAGGVGQILVQWAKHLGATVIGCVSTPEKAEMIKALGADHAILHRDEDVAARVKEITGGKGVIVSYDSVGKATLDTSLASLSPFGMLVSYGNSSGPITDLALGRLAAGGSLFVTRPTLVTHTATRELLMDCANQLFDVVASGAVKINIGQTYPLRDAKQAHDDLEASKTTGSTVLLP